MGECGGGGTGDSRAVATDEVTLGLGRWEGTDLLLTDQQKSKVTEWLNEHWKGRRPCPICQRERWTIADRAMEVREFHEGDLVAGGVLVPFIVVSCLDCGFMRFFNGVVMGLFAQKREGANG